MGLHQNMTGAQRVARHRAAKRAQGLRLKQIWVPDLNSGDTNSAIPGTQYLIELPPPPNSQ